MDHTKFFQLRTALLWESAMSTHVYIDIHAGRITTCKHICIYIVGVSDSERTAVAHRYLPVVARVKHKGPCSLSGKTSYRKISWSFEATRFGFRLFQSLWNLTGTSTASLSLSRCLSNFRVIQSLYHPISRPRDFTRFVDRTFVWATGLRHKCGCKWPGAKYAPANDNRCHIDYYISQRTNCAAVIYHCSIMFEWSTIRWCLRCCWLI